MDTDWLKLLAQVPVAGAIIFIVLRFIAFIKDDRAQQQQERLQFQQFFSELHKEHLDARSMTRAVMEKHVDITRENIVATQRNTDKLERLSQSIERCGLRVEPPENNK